MKKQALVGVLACALLVPSAYSMEGNGEQSAQVNSKECILQQQREQLDPCQRYCGIVTLVASLLAAKTLSGTEQMSAQVCTPAQLDVAWQRCLTTPEHSCRHWGDPAFFEAVQRLKKIEQAYNKSQKLVQDNPCLNVTYVCETYTYNPEQVNVRPDEAEAEHINYYCQKGYDLPHGAPFEQISDEVIKECFDVDEDGDWHYKPAPESFLAKIGQGFSQFMRDLHLK